MILALEIEIVDLDPVRDRLRDDPAWAERVLAPAERSWCLAQADPAPPCAARLAAKAAALRALGFAGDPPPWLAVEIERDPSGKPRLRLEGPAETAARERGVRRAHVTLTHARGQAAAVVVLES